MSIKRVDPAIRTKSEREFERWRLRVRDSNVDTSIHAGDTTIHHTFEAIMDNIAAMLAAGTNITLSYNDATDTLTITANLANHLGAADPHGQYQKESEKGVASGYASLAGDVKVTVAQLRNPMWIGVSAPDPNVYPVWLDTS